MAGWVIRWVSPTGVEGGGRNELRAYDAAGWLHFLLIQHPDWQHWLEKVES